ncbi:MAG: hypothetical protein FJ314_09490 [SAR202 cluster bacterium]|nr:hypothetical protein [SAR202 cluster bacterium]
MIYGELIAVGHEILMGEIVDTNTAYLAQRLVDLGITPRYSCQVGDNIQHLVETFARAHARSDVVVSTGGLGPTSDDLTREAVAQVLGEEMKVDPSQLDWLEGVFRQRGIAMPKTNLKQATLIPSAAPIPNPTGTAPGWWAQHAGRHIVLLPGPPRELQLMWEQTVGPGLARAVGAGAVATRTIKTFGITEGGIDEMLAHLFGKENPYLGIYARPDGIHLRLIAHAPSRAEAMSLISPIESEIVTILGGAVWGYDGDSAGSRVATLLDAAKLTVAIGEGVTAGLISAGLAPHLRKGRSFLGGYVIGRASKGVPGPLDEFAEGFREEDAIRLASAVMASSSASVGLGVTVASKEADSAGTYHIGITGPRGSRVFRGRSMPSPEVTMQRGATQAMLELVSYLSWTRDPGATKSG